MITPIATLARDKAHMAPVADLLPHGGDVALVACYGDLKHARRRGLRRIVLMQHGAGQSYGADPRSHRHPSYAGGFDNDDVGLFLVPNEHAADRWRRAYPRASVAVVGCPRLDSIPHRVLDEQTSPVVAVSFHWTGSMCPELRSAFAWYRSAVVELSRTVKVIGHGHPKAGAELVNFYRKHGIEHVADFDEVCRRADVYACDNSSTLYEFASTGRPVIVLNAPWYRREARHGLRFWEAAGVGVNVWQPDDLVDAVGWAFEPEFIAEREAALDIVYAYRTGAAQRAADAIMAWAGMEVAA